MALSKALDQDAYLAVNVYGSPSVSGDVEGVLGHLADPTDRLSLRLSTEERVRAVLDSATRQGGPVPMATELMAIRDAAAARFADPTDVPPPFTPRTAAEADEVVAAVVEEAEAHGLTVPPEGPGPENLWQHGVVPLSPFDPAIRESEAAIVHAGASPVYFVPALASGRLGPRSFREGTATFSLEAATACAAARDAERAAAARDARGARDEFFCLVGPMDECGLSSVARYADKKAWGDLRLRVCGTRSIFGDYRGGTAGRHGRFAAFSKGDLARYAARARQLAASALGKEPDQNTEAAVIAAGLARTRHAVGVGLACLEEFDRAGADVTVKATLDADAAARGDFLQVDTDIDADGSACHCRCAATGYGAPAKAPRALRDAMEAADRAGSVINIYDGPSRWRVVESSIQGRPPLPSPNVDALDGRGCVRMWLGAPAIARDSRGDAVVGPDGMAVRAAATDPASLGARGIDATVAANLADKRSSVALRPGRVPDRVMRLVVSPASGAPAAMRVASPGLGFGRSVDNVDRAVARRELSWMVEEAVAAMADRAAPARLLAAVRAGADPADFAFDQDRQVASFQRSMLDYLTGRTDDPPVDDGETFEATIAERGRSCARVAEAWARQCVGRVTDDAAHVCPGRLADFAPSFDGRITTSQKVDALMRQAGIAADEVFGEEGTFERDLEAMVAFDEDTAVDSRFLPESRPMARAATAQVLASLRAFGITDGRCEVDGRGVMRYTGRTGGKNAAAVTGYLGQVFEADGDGVVRTTYLGREDHCFVPAMRGRYSIRSKAYAEPWERLEIEGAQRRLRRAVARQVALQVMGRPDGRSPAKGGKAASMPALHGETALNRAWRAIEEGQERWPVDFKDVLAAHGHNVAALIARAQKLVRLPAKLAEQAGAGAHIAHTDSLDGADPEAAHRALKADRTGDGYDLTGHACVRQAGYDHMFDPVDIVYTGGAQGLARVLGEGVEVVRGRARPAAAAEVFGPLTAKGVHRHTREHCAADRAGMTLSNNRHAVWADQKATVAQMCLGGLTMEDAFVVSAAWAAAHPVPAKDGGTRPLMAGDKICDKAGNKGVISFVADPDAPTDGLGPAKAAAVRLFAENPHLDMVASGFSNLSRLNAGTLLEMMENPHDLVVPALSRRLPEVALPEVDPGSAWDRDAALAAADALFEGPARAVALTFGDGKGKALVEVGEGVAGTRRKEARSVLADAMAAVWADAQAAAPGANAIRRVTMNGERDRLEAACRKRLLKAERAGEPLGPVSAARTVAGGCGTISVDVTDKLADKKTSVYDRRRGEGRKASAQLLSVLTQEGCDALVGELYGRQSSFDRVRQLCCAFGVAVDGAGDMAVLESASQIPGQRIELPAPTVRCGRPAKGTGAAMLKGGASKDGKVKVPELDEGACRAAVARVLTGPAGYVVLPFPVELGTHRAGDPHVAPMADGGGWCLPVVGPEARRSTVGPDGRERESDLTRDYAAILTQAVRHGFYARAAGSFAAMGDEREAACRERAAEAEAKCRSKARSLAAKLEAKVCSGKDNEFVSGLMKARLPGTSTAVWHPDPDLSVTQVALSPEVAENAQVKDGDHVLILRDPILRSGGVRYMEVVTDDKIAGIAVNPVVAQSMDGDFDGDTIGVIPVTDPAARAEAARSFSCASLGVRVDRGAAPAADGTKPLYFNCGSDVRMGCARSEGLADAIEADRALANNGDPAFAETFDGHVQEALSASIYEGHIVVEDPKAMADTLYSECVETGVKGSVDKLVEFMDYAGYDLGVTPDGRPGQVVPGGSGRDRDRTLGSQLATAIKTEDTGKAGAITKYAVSACRGGDVVAATECTYGVTQGLLQAKHDPVDAMRRHRLVGDPVRNAFRGITAEGKRADPVEYAANLKEVMCGPDGLGLSLDPAMVDSLAAQVTVEDPAGGKTVCDMTSKSYGEFVGASPLDFLAYHFGPDSARQVAEAGGANVYDGLEAAAPAQVRREREELGRGSWTSADARALFEERRSRAPEPVRPTFLSDALGVRPTRSRGADGPEL